MAVPNSKNTTRGLLHLLDQRRRGNNTFYVVICLLFVLNLGSYHVSFSASAELITDERSIFDPRLQQHGQNIKDWMKQQQEETTNRSGGNLNTEEGTVITTKKSVSESTTRAIQADHTFNVLVVLLQWKNHGGRPMISPGAIEEMWNGEGVSDNFKSGSIANWTAVNSHGKWKTNAIVSPQWIQMPENERHYADGNSGYPQFTGSLDRIEEGIAYAMEQLDDMGAVDFRDFDQDSDGILDSVMFIHSGYDAASGLADCNNPSQTAQHMIASIARHAGNIEWRSSGQGNKRLGNYAIDSAYVGTCDFTINRIGITAHEFMHTVGLPDLYDLGGRYDPSSPYVAGLGAYDIMSNPSGQGNKLKVPGHLSPWSKIEMGWINPPEITQNGQYTLRASELYEDYYIISQPFPSSKEYLVIENRQPLLFDERLWTPGGIVIYHIDDNKERQDDRGFPGQNNWPQNGNHYQVAVLQADGNYDLEKSANDGHNNDFWKEGQRLGPGPNNHPNTDAYAFGNVVRTGITIENFQEVESGVWSFEVSGLDDAPVAPEPTRRPTPQPTRAPTKAPTKQPTKSPTKQPTKAPTKNPTRSPTKRPTPAPTPAQPSKQPTPNPTLLPPSSPPPTKEPTSSPTETTNEPPAETAPTTLPPFSSPPIFATPAPTLIPDESVDSPTTTPGANNTGATPAPGSSTNTTAPGGGSPSTDANIDVDEATTSSKSGLAQEEEVMEKKTRGLIIGFVSLLVVVLGGLVYYFFMKKGSVAAAATAPTEDAATAKYLSYINGTVKSDAGDNTDDSVSSTHDGPLPSTRYVTNNWASFEDGAPSTDPPGLNEDRPPASPRKRPIVSSVSQDEPIPTQEPPGQTPTPFSKVARMLKFWEDQTAENMPGPPIEASDDESSSSGELSPPSISSETALSEVL